MSFKTATPALYNSLVLYETHFRALYLPQKDRRKIAPRVDSNCKETAIIDRDI